MACPITRPSPCPGTAVCAWRVWAWATTSMASSFPHSRSATIEMLRLLGAPLMKPTASLRLTPLLWTLWSQTPCSSLHIHKRTATWCPRMLATPRRQSTSPRTPSPTTTATPSCTDTPPQLQSSPLSRPPSPLPTWDAQTLWPCITLSTAVPATPRGILAGQDSSPPLPTPTLTQTAWSRCTTLSCWPRWTAASSSSIWVPLRRVRTWQACRTGHTRLACKDLKASYHRCCQTPAQLCITVATTTPNLLPGLSPCCKDTWSDLKSLQLNLNKNVFIFFKPVLSLLAQEVHEILKWNFGEDCCTVSVYCLWTLVLSFFFHPCRDMNSFCDNKYCTATILKFMYILKVFFLYFLHFWEINFCKYTFPLLYLLFHILLNFSQSEAFLIILICRLVWLSKSKALSLKGRLCCWSVSLQWKKKSWTNSLFRCFSTWNDITIHSVLAPYYMALSLLVFPTSTWSWMGSQQHQLLTWKQGSDPASWPGRSGGNLSVCVTHGALFSQHGSAVYAPDILPVNDLVSSD